MRRMIIIMILLSTTVFGQSFSCMNFCEALPFPLSEKAKKAFVQQGNEMDISSLEQAQEFMYKLLTAGEILMPKNEQQETASFYAKATATLSPSEQRFVKEVNLGQSLGKGFSAKEQQRCSALLQKGFLNLSEEDNSRFLELRGNAISLALLNDPQLQTKSAHSSESSSNQRNERLAEIVLKGFSALTESEQARYLELSEGSDLSNNEFKELIHFTNKMTSRLSDSDMEEMRRLTGERLENKAERVIENGSDNSLSNDERERMRYLHEKALSLLQAPERMRLIELGMKSSAELSQKERVERVKATEDALNHLSAEEQSEFKRLSIKALGAIERK